MTIEFTPWPIEFAQRYRDKGYWRDCPLTQLIQRAEPHLTAIVCGERQFTYQELNHRVNILARYLLNQGLVQGDTALVQLPNIAEFYIVFFALLKIGVIPVNALFNHNENELRAYGEQLQPKLLIASTQHRLFQNDQFYKTLQKISPELQVVLLVEDSDWACSMSQLNERKEISRDVSELLNMETPADQVAFFQLSGGSTGQPKMIPRTHNDYDFSIRRSAEICGLSEQTCYLCALPCAHNYPMSSPGALGVFWAGGTVVMSPNTEASTCFELIEKQGVTMVALVPPAAALWVEYAKSTVFNLLSLKLVQIGGAKLSDTLARKIPEVFDCKLQQVLGMAEGLVNYTRLNDDLETIISSQGKPMCSMDEVKIVDESGNAVTDGVVGELVTRGPYTIRGYYKAVDHNRKVFDKEGFYHSGDLVRRDERGYLTVVGRDKDQINRGGEKIAAEEIENLLLKHDLIIHTALVAMPDAMMGEKSCAFIVTKPLSQKLKSVTLRKYLRTQGVADYKLPDRFEFIDTLPLTPVGKPNKVVLSQRICKQLVAEQNVKGNI